MMYIELVVIQGTDMKPKKTIIPIDKFIKRMLVGVFLLLVSAVSAQKVSIKSNDPASGEVSTGAPNTATFTIERDFTSPSGTTVIYTLSGTATHNDDYQHDGTITNTVQIQSMETEKVITVTIEDDMFVEGEETIVVTLVSSSNGMIDNDNKEVTITIADNDKGIITLNTDTLAANGFKPTAIEGGQNGQFSIQSDKANNTGEQLTVFFSITGTSGSSGTGASFDHDLTGAGTVNVAKNGALFPNGSTTRNISVVPFDDNTPEPDKTVIITLTSLSDSDNFTIGTPSTATVTILANDGYCAAAPTAPVRNSATSDFCNEENANLNTLIQGGAGSAPSDTSLEWSTEQNPNVDGSDFLSSSTVTTSGTYYAVYWYNSATENNCVSPATAVVLNLYDAPEAGEDNNTTACNNPNDDFGDTEIDLDDMLSAGVSPGDWTFNNGPDTVAPDADNKVDFSNKAAGTYNYTYTTNNANAPCVEDTASFTVVISNCDLCVVRDEVPDLDENIATAYCDEPSVDLDTFIVGGTASAPTGSSLRWSTVQTPNANGTDFVSNTATTTGVYYAVYWDQANNCVSESTAVNLTFSSSPTAGNDNTTSACNNPTNEFGQTEIDLDDFLTSGVSPGDWTYEAGPEILNPDGDNKVNFSNKTAGSYSYKYTTTNAIAPCENDEAAVTVTVSNCDLCVVRNVTPELNTATATAYCDEPNVDLDTFIVGGASSAPAGSNLKWSTIQNPNVNGADFVSNNATASGEYYAVYWDEANDCVSESTRVALTLSFSPTAGNDNSANACNNATDEFGTTEIDLDNLLSPSVSAGVWTFVSGSSTVNPGGGNKVDFSNKTAGTYLYKYTTTGATPPCQDDSATFTITVADCDPCQAGKVAPALNGGIPLVFCGPITTKLDDYAPNDGPGGTVLRWSVNQVTRPVESDDFLTDGGSIENNPMSGTYFGYYYDAVNKCVSPALEITLLSKSIPTIESVTGDTRCGAGEVTLLATASDDATINWYDSPTGGSIIFSGSSYTPNPELSESKTYYVEATLNGCESTLTQPRQEVVATIVPQPSAGMPINDDGKASACNVARDFGVTQLDLDELITDEDEGVWMYTSGPDNTLTIPAGNLIDFEDRPDGDYVFTFTTTGAQAPCENESSQITISVNDCDRDTDLDGLFDGPESVLGTNPNNPDTDGDGVNDGDEVGADLTNPLDEDQDDIIDALESNTADVDNDGVVDQKDNANENPCIPSTLNGVCDSDDDGLPDSVEDTNANGMVDEGESDPFDPCDPNINNSNCNPDPIDLEVLKTVDNSNALIGETIVFTVTVNNLSNAVAKNVVIGDLLENGFEYQSHTAENASYDPETGMWTIPIIPANGSASLDVTAIIGEGGTYFNTAELLDSFPDDNNEANNAATVTLPIFVDLEVLKTVDNISGLVGETIMFTLTVNNLSNREAKNVIVRDLLADGFEYQSHAPEMAIYNPETGDWTIASIAANESATLNITVEIIAGTNHSNTAELISSFPVDNNEANDTSATITLPLELPEGIDLIIEKTASSENPLVNDEIVFTIKVMNASIDEPPVTNIEVSDVLDEEAFEYIDHETAVGTYDNDTGIWSIPSINRNDEVELTITVKLPHEGTFTNTATIVRSLPADGNPDNNESSVRIRVSLPTPADVGFLYNQFSPNGDGANDVLKINRINEETLQAVSIAYNIQIFNRYGNLVFEANNKSDSEVWDGTWKGKEAPSGTYFYTMNIDIGEGPELKKGWIQLIR